ncbi:Zinc finger and BTB domain-containing protein 7A [Mizuhopecten yessoensis]|uniref:Zinc finger and BTB domain-containing protein 7A n=1 Tax=Mizuhopecten yessoensis TaxID=6573 RepID=A0A210Q3G3_MIZYE|nr:Zinc finger and BTB domain-containing protein 7A [Mizuhopecten yessoensis]
MSISVTGVVEPNFGSDSKLGELVPESGVEVQNPFDTLLQGTLPKPYVCLKCGKEFTHKQTLRYHDISQHTGSYKFKCQQCGKGFYQKYRYEQHLRKHANIRSYICSLCHRGFFSRDALRDHTKKCEVSMAMNNTL